MKRKLTLETMLQIEDGINQFKLLIEIELVQSKQDNFSKNW